MLGEEVGVDHRRHQGGQPRAVAGDPQIEPTPRLADVAADGGVHEAAVERDAGHRRDAGAWVGPRALVHLEQLEPDADGVEDDDDTDFSRGLPSGPPQHGGDEHAPDEQRVGRVERQWDDLHEAETGEEQTREQAALGFEPREPDELPHRETVRRRARRWAAPALSRCRPLLRQADPELDGAAPPGGAGSPLPMPSSTAVTLRFLSNFTVTSEPSDFCMCTS